MRLPRGTSHKAFAAPRNDVQFYGPSFWKATIKVTVTARNEAVCFASSAGSDLIVSECHGRILSNSQLFPLSQTNITNTIAAYAFTTDPSFLRMIPPFVGTGKSKGG